MQSVLYAYLTRIEIVDASGKRRDLFYIRIIWLKTRQTCPVSVTFKSILRQWHHEGGFFLRSFWSCKALIPVAVLAHLPLACSVACSESERGLTSLSAAFFSGGGSREAVVDKDDSTGNSSQLDAPRINSERCLCIKLLRCSTLTNTKGNLVLISAYKRSKNGFNGFHNGKLPWKSLPVAKGRWALKHFM